MLLENQEKNNQEKRLLVLHLSLIEGVGPATIDSIIKSRQALLSLPEISLGLELQEAQSQKLLLQESWSDTYKEIYQYTVSDFIRMGLSRNIAELVQSGLSNRAILEKELAYIDTHAITWITLYDTEYPFLLKNISYPPAIIYTRGAQLSVHKKNVALVGSRAADAYAKQVVDAFVPELVAAGWSIVSGGALGVDSMAHIATVAARGRTVVVLGSGLLRPYPRGNTKLFNQIAESGGTIVSSFGLTVDPMAGNFPARNRIIAGLSSGCVVVQAARKSGASITAQYALDSGRTVFAVPGMIDNPLSAGCHALLQEGAYAATSAADILRELGEPMSVMSGVVKSSPVNGVRVTHNKEDKGVRESFQARDQLSIKEKNNKSIENKKVVEKNMNLFFEKSKHKENQEKNSVQENSVKENFETIESRILFYCTKPCSLEELAQHINQSPYQAQQVLSDMQLDGYITQNFAGLWLRV